MCINTMTMARCRNTMLSYLTIYFVCVSQVFGELFNLFGEAGQAYAIEVNLGHPHQKLNLLVDTGSTTLAVASQPTLESERYFRAKNSSSISNSGKEVQARYSQGKWWGKLASDFMHFPSLQSVQEVRTDIALITKSENFFVNGSGWQGLLGLAYLPVGAWGDNVIVESWLDSLDRAMSRTMSFQMKLCGPLAAANSTHYGRFSMIDDETKSQNLNKIFKTPILRKQWYEIGVLSIRVKDPNENSAKHESVSDKDSQDVDEQMCRELNGQKSIVDSGTTRIRFHQTYFKQVVDQLRTAAQMSNVLIVDDFWYHGEAACWPEPQQWSLPSVAIDLLSDGSDEQYFTLEIPSQNYMRVVKAKNNTGLGTVSEYCYKLGLEGSKETVLGYTAMEGFEVIFNRSADWIGFQTSTCGSETRITGPHNSSHKLARTCQLIKLAHEVDSSIKAAQWALLSVSIIASGVLVYLLAPCVRTVLVKRLLGSEQMSLSQAALVEREPS